MGRITSRRRVTRVNTGDDTGPEIARAPDSLAVEEPLEIRVGGRALAVTMRTPGYDVELAAGFLVSEGVASALEDIHTARYCAGTDDDGRNTYNVLDVELGPGATPPDVGVERNFYTTSACGLCGKASIDAVRTRSAFDVVAPAESPLTVDPARLAEMPGRLREHQDVFDKTGGLHAAGLFNAEGELLVVREDVGRHNAVDKAIGWALTQDRLPLRDIVLMVSGRAGFELVQKAMMAGIPMMTAVSAPSSLAVEMAVESKMTLVGFLRGSSMVVYSYEERVVGMSPARTSETSQGAA